MIDKSELIRVPAFADLPDDQITWFLAQTQEVHLKAGDTYVRQGDPADWMFVILEGQFQWRGGMRGGTILVFGQTGGGTRGGGLFPVRGGAVIRAAGTHSPGVWIAHLRVSSLLSRMDE